MFEMSKQLLILAKWLAQRFLHLLVLQLLSETIFLKTQVLHFAKQFMLVKRAYLPSVFVLK